MMLQEIWAGVPLQKDVTKLLFSQLLSCEHKWSLPFQKFIFKQSEKIHLKIQPLNYDCESSESE
jgi:hypothetical protein